MSWAPAILIEVVLIGGGVLAFGLWELRVLRIAREEREARERKQEPGRT